MTAAAIEEQLARRVCRRRDPPDDIALETHETVELTAGRIETRRHTVGHKVDWITSDRHYPAEPVFPDLAMIGRIETHCG